MYTSLAGDNGGPEHFTRVDDTNHGCPTHRPTKLQTRKAKKANMTS